ncbi:hypothetical protein DRN86_03590 [Candidatus Geothermarchaeota archaeon]|nr:MAG: hypothetical protein DRN86_03590 [Candidatus Geothermarchaeota archaeon]
MAVRFKDRFKDKDIPCELCRYSKLIGGYPRTYCEKQRDIICDLAWVNPEMCWKYCECLSCPYFEPRKEVIL